MVLSLTLAAQSWARAQEIQLARTVVQPVKHLRAQIHYIKYLLACQKNEYLRIWVRKRPALLAGYQGIFTGAAEYFIFTAAFTFSALSLIWKFSL